MLLKAWIVIQLLHYCLCAPNKVKGKRRIMNEKELEAFFGGDYETNSTAMCQEIQNSEWSYNDDINNARKEKNSTQTSLKAAKMQEYYFRTYFQGLSPKNFKTEKMQRLVRSVTDLGDGVLPDTKFERLANVINAMGAIYSRAKVCPFEKRKCHLNREGLSQDPDIEEIVLTSRNVSELAYIWTAWRDATGKKMKKLYQEYVSLKNEAAMLNGFSDAGQEWIDDYETKNLDKVVDELWREVEPFYDDLHYYVRMKLKQYYGNRVDMSDGLLPAYITGNLYAQTWSSLMPIVVPYRNVASVDLTSALKEKNYTVLKLFETANDFYKSMGFADASMSYGEKARIEKPRRPAVCHASAWDFCDGKDFRISMCAKVSEEDFRIIHHEMGHIHYYMQYKDHLFDFRNAPNPGFHEAIGDSIVLSVMNPTHLQKIGLTDTVNISKEADINALMEMALKTMAFLPYGLILDKWRWDVFSGKYSPDQWNDRWWYYRTKIQKVKPPNKRTNMDFDAGSKYHVPGDTQYMAYFIAHIVQFQLYRGMCTAAGQYKHRGPTPLHKCDIYESKAAGQKLMSGLKLGSSVHWSVALKKMTGESELSTSALLDYFEPLRKFLIKKNSRRGKKRKGKAIS